MKKHNMIQQIDETEQQEYIAGMKRYQAKGIPVLIDGKKPDEDDWSQIFEVREDGSFYMSDYVGMEEGALREIHFDRVYHT